MPTQPKNRPITNTGSLPVKEPRQPVWKRVEIWALGVSVVALIPSLWLIIGLPTIGDFIVERQTVASYFRAITGESSGTESMSEKGGDGLAYAAPESDAWTYAAQHQKQWTAFESGEAGNTAKVDASYDEFTHQLCQEGGKKGCSEVSNLKFDDQHRLESFTVDRIPISALTIKSADGPYTGNRDSSVRVTLKGGQRYPHTDYLALVFEIWNTSGSDVTVKRTAALRDFEKDAIVGLVGPQTLVQGQRALYYTAGVGKKPQWLQFDATIAAKGKFVYFLPLS